MHTTARQKLLVTIINTVFVIILSLPLLIMLGISLEYRIILVLSFLAYQLVIVLTPHRRSLGAVLTHTVWSKKYPLKNNVIYAFLYSLSFATLVVWFVFPFDLLLINLLLIQLPFIKKTGYTLHGYLSGGMSGKIEV